MKKFLVILFAALSAWMPLSAQHTVSGNLWNANNNNPVWYIKTTYAYLIDNALGTVVARTPITNGTWSFSNVPDGDYIVRVSSEKVEPGDFPPPAKLIGLDCDMYSYTDFEAAPGSTRLFSVAGANVNNLVIRAVHEINDCGMDGPPVPFDVVKNITGAPALGVAINLGDQPLNGIDRVTTGTTVQSWAGRGISITLPPTNGFILKYNGEPVEYPFRVDNYTPALLTIEPGPETEGGVNNTVFSYRIIDNANLTSAESATYTINFSDPLPLPVVFGTVNATLLENSLVVNFTTEKEENVDHFEIEASADGINFTTIGTLTPQSLNGNSNGNQQYQFSLDAGNAAGLLGLSIFGMAALSLVKTGRRKKLLLSALILAGTVIAVPSCSKNDVSIKEGKQLYVRVAQYDKNGAVQYSKVIKAVNE